MTANMTGKVEEDGVELCNPGMTRDMHMKEGYRCGGGVCT